MSEVEKKPSWLKVRMPPADVIDAIHERLSGLNTVCMSAKCPNLGECFKRGTATFMILGDICTRECGFCGVKSGIPGSVDADEPSRVAEAIAKLGLSYSVITSVTRDDLADGGAEHFAKIVRAIRREVPGCKVEVLIPDLQGNADALKIIIDSKPDVINHNIETIPSLYPKVRPQADFERSIGLLAVVKELDREILTKSGLMVGVGETFDEVIESFIRLREAGCDLLTVGQYLCPGKGNIPVERYVHPDEFEELRRKAMELGFRNVASGPFVRSSYFADEQASL